MPPPSRPTSATPPTPKPRRPPKRPSGRGRTAWRIVKLAILAYLVWVLALLVYMGASLQKVDALSANPIEDTSGTVWLLVGSDSREGLTAEEQSELRTGGDVGERTDTIMLVHTAIGQAPTVISLPRDSWVTIPAHTSSSGSQVGASGGKINAAFAYGGAPLLTETVEYNTGLHVDHYMEIGFGGIVSLTDAVGGIEACFDEAIEDKNSGLDVQAGCQTLDGKQALAYVRMRYADPKGDIGRIERQQHYVAEVVDGILSVNTLVNPFRQVALANAALGAVTVDNSTGVLDLGVFGLNMGRVATGKGEISVVPIDDSDHWEGGQWVIHWDEEEADSLFSSLGGSTPQSQRAAGR